VWQRPTAVPDDDAGGAVPLPDGGAADEVAAVLDAVPVGAGVPVPLRDGEESERAGAPLCVPAVLPAAVTEPWKEHPARASSSTTGSVLRGIRLVTVPR
jgi:hypothetical protein